MRNKNERKKHHGFRNFIFFCLIIIGLWYISTFTIKTTEITIKSSKINNPITFVQLTDLHGTSFGKNNKRLIDKIDAVKPDFIIATGDMYTANDNLGRDVATKLLSNLAQKYTVYSVNGEHDDNESYKANLRSLGIDVLDYNIRDITVGSTTIRLYGINNVYYSDTFNLNNAFDIDKSKFNLLAAHITNFKAFSNFGVDLSICGDSHGGQVRLPFIGGLINRNVWLPERKEGEEKYVKGLYSLGDSKLFVSSGLGNNPYPLRLFNRPEIAVIHLEGE